MYLVDFTYYHQLLRANKNIQKREIRCCYGPTGALIVHNPPVQVHGVYKIISETAGLNFRKIPFRRGTKLGSLDDLVPSSDTNESNGTEASITLVETGVIVGTRAVYSKRRYSVSSFRIAKLFKKKDAYIFDTSLRKHPADIDSPLIGRSVKCCLEEQVSYYLRDPKLEIHGAYRLKPMDQDLAFFELEIPQNRLQVLTDLERNNSNGLAAAHLIRLQAAIDLLVFECESDLVKHI